MNLSELIRSPGFQAYESDKLGNDLFVNDPERADRIYKAAEHGIDGSTHAEHIEDWRDYLKSLGEDEITEDDYTAIEAEIDKCEEWHRANGSLEEQGS